MKKTKKIFNISTMEGLTDEIAIVIKDKEYIVKNLRREVMTKIAEVESQEGLNAYESLSTRLAIFFGVTKEEIMQYDLDVRELKGILTLILGELEDAGKEQRKHISH